MSMSRDGVFKAVREVLKSLIVDTPEVSIDDETDPITELGLESEDGIELACDIEEPLGISLPLKVNPFIDDRGQPRNVGQIVDFLVKFLPKGEEKHGRRSSV